jgi:hypothetical protein
MLVLLAFASPVPGTLSIHFNLHRADYNILLVVIAICDILGHSNDEKNDKEVI